MAEKKLFEILKTLKDELKKPLNAEDKKKAETIVRDIENFLTQDKKRPVHERGKFSDQLKNATEHFEESHPEFSIQIGRVMDLLNQMGI